MAKSVWEEFKDLFKTKEQREQEKRDKISDALEREKDVVQQLEELDKQYRDSLPEEQEEEPDLEAMFPSDSGLKELEYDVETDEELEQRARDLNDEKKAADAQKLQNNFQKEADAAELKKQEAKDKLESKNSALDGEYAARAENAKDDALQNGVSRGSILSSVLGELAGQKRSEKAAAGNEYETKIASIDDKLSNLESELNSALEQLDMKYAVKLSEDIAELKKERDEQVRKLDKYNQEIRRQQAEYAYEREQDINEFLAKREQKKQEKALAEQKQEEKYGYQGEKQENYAKRYELAYEFYSSLDPSIALEAFEASPYMKYYLGLYYDKLKKELKSHSTGDSKLYF